MADLRRIFQGIMVVGLFLVLGGSGQLETAVSQPITKTTAPQPVSVDSSAVYTLGPRVQTIPDNYDLVGENANFQLYANDETLAFKVVDKRSDYIWHSNLDEVTDDDDLNRTWTAFAQSGITLEYLDDRANDERLSITNTDTAIDYREIEQGLRRLSPSTKPPSP